MEKIVARAIEHFSLLEGDVKNVTVALSGGADSMALLNALLSLRDELNINVSAAHLNHMIRGAEADRDEAFVKATCSALDVKLYCERADIPRIAAERGVSLETAARNVRYEFLERVSEGLVATAHNSDDNLETVIFNLTRGTSLDGLCGIPPKRGIFIRPLLLCTRAQIEAYCEQKGISFVTDSTNLSDDYTRNKIRHRVVPVLRELNPSVEGTVTRTCEGFREISLMLKERAEALLNERLLPDNSLSAENFYEISKAEGLELLKIYVERLFPEISLEGIHIEALYKTALNGGRTSLPKNLSAVCRRHRLYICEANNAALPEYNVEICEKSSEFLKENKKINNLLLNNLLDCDRIVGKSVIRTRMSGDGIRLLNRGCTKTLNKLFTEYGIPTEERDSIPVIADEKGIIWVYKLGVANRCAVVRDSKKILEIKVTPKERT